MCAVAFNLGGSKELNKLIDINNSITNCSIGTSLVSDDNGIYAEFTDYYRGRKHLYRIYTTGELLFKSYMDLDANFDYVNIYWVKHNTYPEVTIGGVRVKLYNLVHACFEPNFVDWFTKGTRHVVNHTVVTRDNYRDCLRPNRDIWANLEYTEVVSIAENNRHGSFINSHGLCDIYVSAFDVDDLTAEFVLYAKANGVSSIYDISYDTKCDIIVDYYDKLRKSGKPVPSKVDFR